MARKFDKEETRIQAEAKFKRKKAQAGGLRGRFWVDGGSI